MSTTIQKKELTPAMKIAHMLKSRTGEIKLALPRDCNISPEQFTHIALSCMMKNPALANTTPLSFFSSVLWLAQIGLPPGGPDQLSYLVPYKDQCTPQIGYRGMLHIALVSGAVKYIKATVVYSGDEFDWCEGLNPDIKHRPAKTGSRGDMTHVYAVAVLPSGEKIFRVMNREDVEKRKAKSLAAKSTKEDSINMWRDFEEEAWMKTAVRALWKYLPHSEKTARVLERETNADIGVTTDLNEFKIEDLDNLPSKSSEIADRLTQDAEVVDGKKPEQEDHTLDEILRLTREATSALELTGPSNMLSRLSEKDRKFASDIIDQRKAEFAKKAAR